MDLYRINLNLLIALDILLAEKSVTASAKKLFITQAAMSNNLQQLRLLFKDELLVREKNYMIPTSYARKLQPKLHQILQELKTLVISGQRFNAEKSERVFKVGMPDYMVSLIVPKFLIFLKKHAPSIKIQIIPINHTGNSEPFERGDYDLAIGKLFSPSHSVRSKLLFKDTGVCILNPKHPLAKKKNITLKDYLAAEHVIIAFDNNPNYSSIIEEALAHLKLKRNAVISLPFITPIFKLIEGSDYLIGSVIKSMALLYQNQQHFLIKPLPFKMPEIAFYLVWHHQHESDLAHTWLRESIFSLGLF